MTNVITMNNDPLAVTPFFKFMEIENIPKSETAGRLIKESIEMVEVRIAGDRNFVPFFPAHAMSHREGGTVITYAERWADQYRAFKEGSSQEAQGTPLEMLRDYGVTGEQLSQCRALRIYSVEALNNLEGANARSLGVNQNKLKDAARKYLASVQSNITALDEIEALKAELARLKSLVPEGVAEVLEPLPDPDGLEEDPAAIKDKIEAITGTRPRGNPSPGTLKSMLAELEAA